MKMVRHKNKGFSLIEMILVLGLSSLAFVGILNYEKRKTENLRAESVGQQFEEVGKALSSYIVKEGTALDTNIPVGTTATIPLTVLQGVSSLPYVGRQYLPTTYSPTSGFGVDYVIQIRNNGGNSLTGMVVSNGPVKDETGQVRYDWIGSALRKAGSQSGSAFFTGASITGLNGGWNISSSEFPAISTAGQIAYRSQYQNNYDNIYLRRDGASPMIGNLNMGNFNIGSTTDISYNGWLYGNNALVNNLKAGYILNTGNMRNEGNLQVIGQGSFESIYVTNGADTGSLHNRGYMQNDGNLAVLGSNGVYIQNGANTGSLYNRGYMQNDGDLAVLGSNGVYIQNGANTGNLYNRGNIQNNGNMQNNGNLTVDGTVSPGWAVETAGCITGAIGKAAYTVDDGWAYNGKTLSCVNGAWKNSAGGNKTVVNAGSWGGQCTTISPPPGTSVNTHAIMYSWRHTSQCNWEKSHSTGDAGQLGSDGGVYACGTPFCPAGGSYMVTATPY